MLGRKYMAYAKVPLKKSGLTLSNAEYSLCRICVHSSSAPVLSGQEDKLDIHIYFQVADRSIHHIPQILVHHMTRVLSEINSQGLGRVKLREQRQLVLHDEKNESSLLSNFHLFTSPRNTWFYRFRFLCRVRDEGNFPYPTIQCWQRFRRPNPKPDDMSAVSAATYKIKEY